MTDPEERSGEACPVCGAHRLTVLDFPPVHGGYRPAVSDGLGVRVTEESSEPAIGCLACGAEWADLASFRASRDGIPTEEPTTAVDAGDATIGDEAVDAQAAETGESRTS